MAAGGALRALSQVKVLRNQSRYPLNLCECTPPLPQITRPRDAKIEEKMFWVALRCTGALWWQSKLNAFFPPIERPARLSAFFFNFGAKPHLVLFFQIWR